MLIGIDFDNTIVSYDALFHRVAIERGLISPTIVASKLAVREHLRGVGREPEWTELQGHVYGARMAEAALFSGAREFMIAAREAGHQLAIVSHKTRQPIAGPPQDLHEAARDWITRHLVKDQAPVVPATHQYFELTKEEKLLRIASLRCDAFIDDLPEILGAAGFPRDTRRILFDPDGHHRNTNPGGAIRCESWDAIARALI